MKLIQCVPNFSEGRDKAKVDSIVKAIASVSGVFMMDVEMDSNHNRSVVTFFGSPEALLEGAFAGAARATQLIDMRQHKGEHPRIGATDVIPFTPVLGVTIEECVHLALRLGERLAKELSIPVYLYGFAARRPERENLAYIRKGEYEGLAAEIETHQERAPDFGLPKLHPTAGATAVGAREHIINFNVNLESSDKALAASIARAIRSSSGGMPHLRAKEIELSDRKEVQISTVLTNYSQTGLQPVLEAIKRRARDGGVEISESELIGLVPARALVDFALAQLQVKTFDPEKQLFENKLLGLLAESKKEDLGEDFSWLAGVAKFCQALADPLPVPGGGSASGALGAIGLSLVEKVLAIHQKKLAKAGQNGQQEIFIRRVSKDVLPMRRVFLELAEKDFKAYAEVTKAYRIPKERLSQREAAIGQALKTASEVPLKTMHLGLQILQSLAEYAKIVPPSISSDFKVGVQALVASILGAKENVLINLEIIKDSKFRDSSLAQVTALDSRLKEFLTTFSLFG